MVRTDTRADYLVTWIPRSSNPSFVQECAGTFDKVCPEHVQGRSLLSLCCKTEGNDVMEFRKAGVLSLLFGMMVLSGCAVGNRDSSPDLSASSTTIATIALAEPPSSFVPEASTVPQQAKPQVTATPTTASGPSAAEQAAQREAAYQQFQFSLFNECMARARNFYDYEVTSLERQKAGMSFWGPEMENWYQESYLIFARIRAGSEQACLDSYNSVR